MPSLYQKAGNKKKEGHAMKSLVVYSSRTGNTKKVAEAIYKALPDPKEIKRVEDAPPADEYDFIAMGFWIERGTADAEARKYIAEMTGKKVGLFGTLGAYPDSDHAKDCINNVKILMCENEILGTFLCQGKVDQALIKMMAKMKDDPHHAMTPEMRARLEEGKKHPDKTDCTNAQKAFEAMVKKLNYSGA